MDHNIQNIPCFRSTDPNTQSYHDLECVSASVLIDVTNNMSTKDNDHDSRSADMTCNLNDETKNEWSDSSLQILENNGMDTCLTPSLQVKSDVSRRNNLFTFHNKKQLFGNNFCLEQKCGSNDNETKMDIDFNHKVINNFNNTLGLSPVKSLEHKSSQSLDKSFSLPLINITNSFQKDFPISDILAKENPFSDSCQLQNISLIKDISFKSVSKCSDFELRDEPKVDINQTFRSPNSNFENKSIETYFRQQSEPIKSFNSMADSTVNSKQELSTQTCDTFSLMNESFDNSFREEIDLANNTLDIAMKVLERKNRKRKSNESNISSSLSTTSLDRFSFAPSINSTLQSDEEESRKVVAIREDSKEDNSSGFGTYSAITQQTYAIQESRRMQTNSNSLSLNQLLSVSPNILSLTIGCFVGFKLNYLKISNQSVSSFVVEIKVNANVDTINSLEIDYPKQSISIPAFFDGLLSDQIVITPLKSGSFQLKFEIYPRIENLNLPINPLTVVCNIKVEELIIKRPFYKSNATEIEYNLFEDNSDRQTINLIVANKNITNEIPLKVSLKPNSFFSFEPIYRHPDSAIHIFRCLDANTMFVTTKTQYEMKIPIRVEANTKLSNESSLTVSIDSNKSHVLAMIRLRATFWPKKQLTEPLLQCSDNPIILSSNQTKSKTIHFRNKSKENLIRVAIKCVRNRSLADHIIRLSTHKLMIKPLEKSSIVLCFQHKSLSDKNGFHLFVSYDSGLGKEFTLKIPIEIQ